MTEGAARKDRRPADAPPTQAELELVDALADWQARRDFARLAAAASRPPRQDKRERP